MSALADKMVQSNLAMPKTDSPLLMASLEFFKKGGGLIHALELVRRAHRQVHRNDDAETVLGLSERTVQSMSPASSPQTNGNGPMTNAQPRQLGIAASVRPPMNLTGPIGLGVENFAAQSVFDRIRTSDGRAWGDVGAHELDGMARDGSLAARLRAHVGTLTNAQRFLRVRDLVNPETFEQLRKQAHGA